MVCLLLTFPGMNTSNGSPFTAARPPCVPLSAKLESLARAGFIAQAAQRAFDAALDAQLTASDLGIAYSPSPVTAARAVRAALRAADMGAIVALNAVEVL